LKSSITRKLPETKLVTEDPELKNYYEKSVSELIEQTGKSGDQIKRALHMVSGFFAIAKPLLEANFRIGHVPVKFQRWIFTGTDDDILINCEKDDPKYIQLSKNKKGAAIIKRIEYLRAQGKVL
jgi:hypothetical protein